MFKTIRKYWVAIQVGNAAVAMTDIIAEKRWLDPTSAEYATAMYLAIAHMRLSADEREGAVQSLAELRADIVKAARKKIKL